MKEKVLNIILEIMKLIIEIELEENINIKPRKIQT